MYAYHDVQTLHLEPTTACNARCPMCARNESGGRVNPKLKLTHLSRENIERFFPYSFRKGLKKLLLCGNFGDPAAAPELLEIVRVFREASPEIKIHINSNGGLRSPDFWKELASLVDRCAFGIDGLEDTNHLYRQGVSWKKLIENVSSFISSGGLAEWHYLIFSHNEHQVDQAEGLAKQLGFETFQAKVTSRFFRSQSGQVSPEFAVRNLDGEISHYLAPPRQERFQNKALIHAKSVNWLQHLDKCKIQCRAMDERGIYVSATGEVYPCCWLGQESWLSSFDQLRTSLRQLMNERGVAKHELSLHNKSLEEIVNGPLFQTHIPESWKVDSDSTRLRTCAKTCGQQLNFFEAQFLKNEEPLV
ncbi:MAG: radical SAM protein [Bdellovibrionales bacterium]